MTTQKKKEKRKSKDYGAIYMITPWIKQSSCIAPLF